MCAKSDNELALLPNSINSYNAQSVLLSLPTRHIHQSALHCHHGNWINERRRSYYGMSRWQMTVCLAPNLSPNLSWKTKDMAGRQIRWMNVWINGERKHNTHTHTHTRMANKSKNRHNINQRDFETFSDPLWTTNMRSCNPGITGDHLHQEWNTSSPDKGEHSHQLCIDLQWSSPQEGGGASGFKQ